MNKAKTIDGENYNLVKEVERLNLLVDTLNSKNSALENRMADAKTDRDNAYDKLYAANKRNHMSRAFVHELVDMALFNKTNPDGT